MKNIKNIIDETPDTFLWDDKETIDITLDDDDNKTFIEILIDYKCIKCGNGVIINNEKMCRGIDDNIRGIEITCKSCAQKWFIHKRFTGF